MALAGWLAAWLWLVGRLAGWLAGRVAPAGRLRGSGWLCGWLAGWLAGRPAGRLAAAAAVAAADSDSDIVGAAAAIIIRLSFSYSQPWIKRLAGRPAVRPAAWRWPAGCVALARRAAG